MDKFSTVSHSIISGLTMPSCSHKCGLATKIFHFGRGSRNYESPCIYGKLSPRGRRDDMRPAAGSSTRGGSTSAVRTSLVAGQLQAASVPIAYAAAPRSQRSYSLGWDRQTDERIAVSVIAPLRRRNNIGSHDLEGGLAQSKETPCIRPPLCHTSSSSRSSSGVHTRAIGVAAMTEAARGAGTHCRRVSIDPRPVGARCHAPGLPGPPPRAAPSSQPASPPQQQQQPGRRAFKRKSPRLNGRYIT